MGSLPVGFNMNSKRQRGAASFPMSPRLRFGLGWPPRLRFGLVWMALAWPIVSAVTAGEEKSEPPRVMIAAPLAIAPGEMATVQLRGMQLDQATKVRAEGVPELSELPIKKKEKSGPPPQVDAKEAGDSLVEFELKLPEGFSAASVMLVVETPEGTAQPHELVVLPSDKLINESEPNERLAKAQPVELGRTIRGAIGQQRDVDAFRIAGKAGQTLVAEVTAARRGSVLDGALTLYDDRGAIVASVDDAATGRDPVLRTALPRDGDYVLVLIDAQDRGGATHPYLLHLRGE